MLINGGFCNRWGALVLKRCPMIDLILAVGLILLGAGIGALAVYLYLIRRMKQIMERTLSGEIDFLKLLNEVKEG